MISPAVSAKQLRFVYRDEAKWKEKFHSHTEYEIYYFHSGRCNYLIGDRVYVLQPGDLIIMDGLTLHRPKTFEGEPYIRTVIHFDGPFFAAHLSSMGMEDLLSPFRKLRSYRIRMDESSRQMVEAKLADMHRLREQGNAGANYRFQIAFLDLLAIIFGLLETPLEERAAFPTEKENHVQNVVNFIERHFAEDLHLQRLEEALHVSKYYLAKVFKEITGTTIFDYLYQRRINQAKIEFFLDPERSVTEVGYQVGFKHLAHFSKVFKQLTGCTPDQFKRTVVREPFAWIGDDWK